MIIRALLKTVGVLAVVFGALSLWILLDEAKDFGAFTEEVNPIFSIVFCVVTVVANGALVVCGFPLLGGSSSRAVFLWVLVALGLQVMTFVLFIALAVASVTSRELASGLAAEKAMLTTGMLSMLIYFPIWGFGVVHHAYMGVNAEKRV